MTKTSPTSGIIEPSRTAASRWAEWKSAATLLKQRLSDNSGNFTMMFALSAPVVLFGVAAAIEYSNVVSQRQRMQSVVDSAALAAVTNFASTKDSTQATNAAWNFLASNTPAELYNASQFTVTTPQNVNNTVMAIVGYTNPTPPSLLSSFTGVSAIQIHVSATAQADIGNSSHQKTYAGMASLWGDPHLTGADGNTVLFACPGNPNQWFNGLSDAGIQMNFNCLYDSYWSYYEATNATFVIGNHRIVIKDNQPSYNFLPNNLDNFTPGVFNYNNQGWFGQFILDGQTINPPIGNSSYDNGLVQAAIWDLTTPNQYDNYITVNFTNGSTKYVFSITFGYWGELQMSVTATNAGLCGVPGGVLGQTLAGADNTDVLDYQMPSQYSTEYNYDWSTCESGHNTSTAQLIQ